MIVRIEADGVVSLVDPGDTNAFHIEAPEGADIEAALEADSAGWVGNDGDVRIEVSWVRDRAAEEGVGPAWEQQFEAMLAFAGTKGWLDDGGTSIRAHVERV